MQMTRSNFGSIGKLTGNRKARRAQSRQRGSKALRSNESLTTYVLDPLEPRILMDAAPTSIYLATISGATTAGAVSATISLTGAGGIYSYNVYDSGQALLTSGQVASTSGLKIYGGDGNDTITLKFGAGFDAGSGFGVSVDGGAGNDALVFGTSLVGFLGSLSLSGETVSVTSDIGSSGSRLQDVTITASASNGVDQYGSASASSTITVANSIFATGVVSLGATASVSGTSNFTGIAPDNSQIVTVAANISVADGVTIDAGSISIVTGSSANLASKTENRLLFVATETVSSTSRVAIGAGTQLLSSATNGITILATDDTDITVEVSALEASLLGEAVFNVNALSVDLAITKAVGVTGRWPMPRAQSAFPQSAPMP